MGKINKTKLLDMILPNPITRVEVIDNTGRAYVNLSVNLVQLQEQDEGRTLKIFIS